MENTIFTSTTNSPYCIIRGCCKGRLIVPHLLQKIGIRYSQEQEEPELRPLKVMSPPTSPHKDHNSVRAQLSSSSHPLPPNPLFFLWQRTCFWTGLTRLASKLENLLRDVSPSKSPPSHQISSLSKSWRKLGAVKQGMFSHSQEKRGVSRGGNTAENRQKHF